MADALGGIDVQKRTQIRMVNPGKRDVSESLEARVGSRVAVQPNGCWFYRGDGDRYHGIMLEAVPGRPAVSVRAHRWFYETLIGAIPEGHHLHHMCRKPGCVNPRHLRPMSPAEHAAHHNEHKRAG